MEAPEVRLIPAARNFDLRRPPSRARAKDLQHFEEVSPVVPRSRRRRYLGRRRYPTGVTGDGVQDPLCRGRSHTRQQLQEPETRDPVAWVLGEAQQGEQIFDMRGVEELQPTEFHERDVPPGQLDLQRTAVVRRPEENRLLLQGKAKLPVL